MRIKLVVATAAAVVLTAGTGAAAYAVVGQTTVSPTVTGNDLPIDDNHSSPPSTRTPQPGDDHGRAAEPGDDHGRAAEPGDDRGDDDAATAPRTPEAGDDRGASTEPGDDRGRGTGTDDATSQAVSDDHGGRAGPTAATTTGSAGRGGGSSGSSGSGGSGGAAGVVATTAGFPLSRRGTPSGGHACVGRLIGAG